MNHIPEVIDSIHDSLKDSLLLIDLDKLDPDNLVILFEKLNRVIIASTLLSRYLEKETQGEVKLDTIEIKRNLLSILKLVSRSIKMDDITRTHDLIRLELRDTLVRWIIQILPQIRTNLAEHQSGQAASSPLS